MTSKPAEEIEVWVTSAGEVATGQVGGFGTTDEVELQSRILDRLRGTAAKVDSAEFIESWKKAFRAVQSVFAADQDLAEPSAFVLESVTAKLSLTASGKVAFVGELGGEIAFEACFKRRSK